MSVSEPCIIDTKTGVLEPSYARRAESTRDNDMSINCTDANPYGFLKSHVTGVDRIQIASLLATALAWRAAGR